MRILVTCNRYPSLPLDGETLRIYHYAKHLSSRHELDLVCLADDTNTNPEIESFFKHVQRIPRLMDKPAPNCFLRLASGLDPRTLFPRSAQFEAYLNNVASRSHYDLIWDAGCYMLSNLGELRRSLPLLADQVDDSFLALRRALRIANGTYKKLWYLKQIGLQWLFQFQHVRNAESVLFVSEKDARSFQRFLPFTRTVVIENGVDENYFHPTALQNAKATHATPEIVFEGSMFFAPNIDAACYFVQAVLPLIRRVIPDAGFTIVGRDPPAEVRSLAGNGIIVTGSVPDVRPYLQRGSVFVCPMRSGAGIKNKILQAWAMGKAIVSTSDGVGSLKVSDGKNILIRNTSQSFADAVVELLRNPTLAAEIGAAGRATIEAHYTWSAKAAEMEALMVQVAATHSANRRGKP
jgi:glycosyltransferase involved in cell wall biosynthesis